MITNDFALVIPMANEEADFQPFINQIIQVLDFLKSGQVYFIIDNVSTDRTLGLCQKLATEDPRFSTVFAPENKNVVDAYLKGYQIAYDNNHEVIIEMDAGLSHDPMAIPLFIDALNRGNNCAFGSRFMNGGSMQKSNFKRFFLSKVGTNLSNLLLGSRMKDMTSGFQGFRREVVGQFLNYTFQSKAHFYQTELRYLLRNQKYIEIPIHYQAPSPRVSKNAIYNSFYVLFYLFYKRLIFKSVELK